MLRKDSRYKLIAAFTAVQMACLAAGLAVHYRCVVSVIHRAAETAAVEPLTAASGDLLAASAVAWGWTSVLLAIATYLIVTPLADKVLENRARAEMESLQYARSLVRTRDALVFGLAEAAEFHDPAIGRHVQRVSLYTHQLAEALRDEPKFRGWINSSFVELLSIASALHDLGKIGIEDSILFKPGRLTPPERARVEQHAAIGSRLLQNIHRRLGSSEIIEMAEVIARSHHERWDGRGFPDGLAGEQIPLAARIVAVADVYEAQASPRDYKPHFPHERCVELIRQEAGKQFDPDVVAAFLRIENVFREINRKYGEQAGQPPPPAAAPVALPQTLAPPGWEATAAPPGPP